jgi:hypothetical protein
MTAEERRCVAFHEAGHTAIIYWRDESLHSRRIVLPADYRQGGPLGSLVCPVFDFTESDLMFLIGGPLSEFLSIGVVPTRAIRDAREYRFPNSDSTRIRNLVKALCGGKDDKAYQFRVQERCREIIQEPHMWSAVSAIAEVALAAGEVSGEKCERIFEQHGALQEVPRKRTPEEIAAMKARANRSLGV